jgi:predicted SAM-dependent methyltransferase
MTNYSGKEHLDVMQFALRYNFFLANLITMNASKQDRIIDFGAGTGTIAKIIRDHGFDILCIEPNTKLRNALNQKLNFKTKKNLNLVTDNSIDFFYSLNVFEHIKEDRKDLMISYKKIKQGGKLLIYVPTFPCLYSNMDREVGHFRRYTKRDLTDKISSAGFVITKIEYVDSLGFFISYLYKFLNKNGKISTKSIIFYDKYIFRISRIIDYIFAKYFFGKNLLIVAKK